MVASQIYYCTFTALSPWTFHSIDVSEKTSMKISNKLIILGASGGAREIYFHIMETAAHFRIEKPSFCFVDEITTEGHLSLDGVRHPIIRDWVFPHGFKNFVIGIADPKLKLKLVKMALEKGLTPQETIIHPHTTIQDIKKIGAGGLIAPGCRLTTNIVIGNYVFLNLNTTVGHDTVIHDYVTAHPGCQISGNVILHAGVLLGSGTVVKEKTTIAAGCLVGAQSVVVKNIDQENKIIFGVPARIKI